MSEEGDTPDKKVSLKYSTCLGACSQGPVVHVDGKMISPQSIGETDGSALVDKISGMISDVENGKSQ